MNGTPAFDNAIRQAVPEALIYPAAARLARQSGNVRLAFNFADRRVGGAAAVVQSSGLPMFDRAALATLGRAHDPPAPTSLPRGSLPLTIIVQLQPE